MFNVSGSQSTSTGFAPKYATTSADAANVIVGTTISSPAATPMASSARWSAAVAELTATACRAPTNRAKSHSNVRAFAPVVIHPERSVSSTARISSSPICG